MPASKHAQERRTVKRNIPVTAIRENVPVMALAGIAFGASYGHIVELCGEHGPHGWKQYATAGVVDLLCIIGAEERQRDKRIGRPRNGRVSWPAVVLVTGIALTLLANIATAEPGPLGYFVAALPAGALLLAVSVLERRASHEAPASTRTERRRGAASTGTADRKMADPVPAPAGAPVPATATTAGEDSPQPWTDHDLITEARKQWREHSAMGVRLTQSRFEMTLKKSPRGGAARGRVIKALGAVRAEMDAAPAEDAAVGQ